MVASTAWYKWALTAFLEASNTSWPSSIWTKLVNICVPLKYFSETWGVYPLGWSRAKAANWWFQVEMDRSCQTDNASIEEVVRNATIDFSFSGACGAFHALSMKQYDQVRWSLSTKGCQEILYKWQLVSIGIRGRVECLIATSRVPFTWCFLRHHVKGANPWTVEGADDVMKFSLSLVLSDLIYRVCLRLETLWFRGGARLYD